MSDNNAQGIEVVNAFFRFARIPHQFPNSRRVTDQTAEVLDEALGRIQLCSSSMTWVPKPTGGRPDIRWLTRTLGKQFIRDIRSQELSRICGLAVMASLRTKIELTLE